MSSEDENYVTVTVKARGHECSILCREATVATVGADGEPGTSLHVGTFDSKSIRVLAEAALSELLSAGVRAGIPMDAMRIELVNAASAYLNATEGADRDKIAHIAKELAASDLS